MLIRDISFSFFGPKGLVSVSGYEHHQASACAEIKFQYQRFINFVRCVWKKEIGSDKKDVLDDGDGRLFVAPTRSIYTVKLIKISYSMEHVLD